ncbi:MAG: hypothetical protein AB1710_08835 [Pseudomonadota bacterium]|jgi:hypothetical protein
MNKLRALLLLLVFPLQGALAQEYAELSIVRPAPEEVVHDNAGRVEVELRLVPPLDVKAGHRIRASLDGVAAGEPYQGAQFALEGVERGAHTLRVEVVDEGGAALIGSAPVVFQMWRASVLFPGRRPQQ